MPKIKTHKASTKRFRITRNGKVMAHPTGARHLMSGERGKSRRHMRRARPLKAVDAKRVKKCM
jgi:large subunit ribosomal protein L35